MVKSLWEGDQDIAISCLEHAKNAIKQMVSNLDASDEVFMRLGWVDQDIEECMYQLNYIVEEYAEKRKVND